MDWKEFGQKAKHTFDEPFEKVLSVETGRNVAAGALSVWLAWKAYQLYKKKLEETKNPDIAKSVRIGYLKDSIPECKYTNDPLDCKIKIQKQIRRLQTGK